MSETRHDAATAAALTVWVRGVESVPGSTRREILVTVTDGTHISEESYTVLRAFFDREIDAQQLLSESDYEQLLRADESSRAAICAAGLLELRDHSKKELRDKLCRRKFSPQAAADAIAYLDEKGLLREDLLLARYVEYFAKKKYWGPAKINAELSRRGLSVSAHRDAYEQAMEDIDFAQICLYHVRKIGLAAFEDYRSRQKHYAALQRRGFYTTHIRAALELLAEEEPLTP